MCMWNTSLIFVFKRLLFLLLLKKQPTTLQSINVSGVVFFGGGVVVCFLKEMKICYIKRRDVDVCVRCSQFYSSYHKGKPFSETQTF